MPVDNTDTEKPKAVPARRVVSASSLIDLAFPCATHPTDEGRAYIEETRALGPDRRVRRSRYHGSVRVADHKSGQVVEAESLGNEYPLVVECGFDDRVVRVDAQTKAIQLDYLNAAARRVRTPIHIDYLVELADQRFVFVEMKDWGAAEAESLAGNPRFTWSATHQRFEDVPAIAATARLGIAHIILTSDDVNNILFANLLFIGKGFVSQWQPGLGTKALLDHMENVGITTYQELTRSPSGWVADDVVGAIANRLVYVDLHQSRLTGFAPVNVMADKSYAALLERSNQVTSAIPDPSNIGSGLPTFDLSRYSQAEIKIGLARLEQISPALRNPSLLPSLTTAQRQLLRKFERADALRGVGFSALLPAFHLRGFRLSRFTPDLNVLVDNAVDLMVRNQSLIVGTAPYGALKIKCEAKGFSAPSRQTFYVRVRKRRAEQKIIKATEGASGEYQARPAKPITQSALARDAKRSWQTGIADHTRLPIKVVTALLGKAIDAPVWLSYMRDWADKRVLAIFLSFRAPSKETIVALLWDCYQRHGRLPDSLLLDGEKSHDSVVVEKLLAQEGVDKLGRRYKAPRDGELIERGFWLLENGLLCYLQGNYVFRKDPKEWPEGWTPGQFADRTLGSLWLAIEQFFFAGYNQTMKLVACGGLTPNDYAAASGRVHGERAFRFGNIDQSRQFLLPLVSRSGHRKLERQTGLRVSGQPYIPPDAIDASLYGREFLVKYDPMDIRYVMVYLNGRWVAFSHRHRERYEGLPKQQLAAISREIIEVSRAYEEGAPDRASDCAIILEKVQAFTLDPLKDFLTRATPPSSAQNIASIDPFSFVLDADIASLNTRVEAEA